MTDALRSALRALRLAERFQELHQDLLETLMAHDPELTRAERRRYVQALDQIARAYQAFPLEEETTDARL